MSDETSLIQYQMDGVSMSTESKPGDGQHGKGIRGLPGREPHARLSNVLRDLARGVWRLRQTR